MHVRMDVYNKKAGLGLHRIDNYISPYPYQPDPIP